MALFQGTARLTGPMGRGAEVQLALESLSRSADPVAKRLIPVEGFLGVG